MQKQNVSSTRGRTRTRPDLTIEIRPLVTLKARYHGANTKAVRRVNLTAANDLLDPFVRLAEINAVIDAHTQTDQEIRPSLDITKEPQQIAAQPKRSQKAQTLRLVQDGATQ
jgi:hypothetical protein